MQWVQTASISNFSSQRTSRSSHYTTNTESLSIWFFQLTISLILSLKNEKKLCSETASAGTKYKGGRYWNWRIQHLRNVIESKFLLSAEILKIEMQQKLLAQIQCHSNAKHVETISHLCTTITYSRKQRIMVDLHTLIGTKMCEEEREKMKWWGGFREWESLGKGLVW